MSFMSLDRKSTLRRGLVVLLGVSAALAAGSPEAARAADVDIRPVAASGVEGAACGLAGVDWFAGPGPNEITLCHGGQNVAIEMFITNLGTQTVVAYQFGLDCNYDFSLSGSIDPFDVRCLLAELPFDSGECLGVDKSRPDWILAPAAFTIAACGTDNVCPISGNPGRFICGAVVVAGPSGSGPGDHYGVTFGFAVGADAKGAVLVGIDPDPTVSLIRDDGEKPTPIGNVTLASITVEAGTCCGVAGAPLSCFSPLTQGECASAGGAWCEGVLCSGVSGSVEGIDSVCATCDVNLPGPIVCNDNNNCTVDVCSCNGGCQNTNTTPAGMCCNPGSGALTPIDDGIACTIDECQSGGNVTHLPAVGCPVALGSRYVRFTAPCEAASGCDDSTMIAIRLAGALPTPPGGLGFLGYVQPDGSIGNQPAYDTPSGWGSVTVSGALIRPATNYEISGELMAGGGIVGTLGFAMPVLGDVDGDGVATFADVLAVVQTFQGLPGTTLEPADLAPCVPDGLVNFADVQWAVFGFQERTFESLCPIGVCCTCPDVCFDYGGFGQLQASCEAPGSDGQWTGGVSCAGFNCQPDCGGGGG